MLRKCKKCDTVAQYQIYGRARAQGGGGVRSLYFLQLRWSFFKDETSICKCTSVTSEWMRRLNYSCIFVMRQNIVEFCTVRTILIKKGNSKSRDTAKKEWEFRVEFTED